MFWLFPALLFVLFAFCVAFCYREGMWSNAITLVNVLFAALLAVNFWEPAARYLEELLPQVTFLLDFAALWLSFSVFLMVFRTITRGISKYEVRFKQVHDQVGSLAFSVLIGCVMVSFATMTLHTSPLAENFLFDGFQPEKKMFFGLAPDRQWLRLVKMESTGALSRWEPREFDPGDRFISNYNERRKTIEEYSIKKQGFTIDESDLGGKIPER